MRCLIGDTPKQWLFYLPLAEYWYNTTHHTAIKMTPFEAVYGHSPPSIRSYITGSTVVASLDETLARRHQMLRLIKENLTLAQMRMRNQANAHRQDRSFEVGTWVWLRLQPYRQISVRGRASPKLLKRYFGPFQILQRLGSVAYELALPDTARIHPVFHVSKLKKYYGNQHLVTPSLDPSVIGTRVALQPAQVLGARELQTPTGRCKQLLIHWVGLPAVEATWEEINMLKVTYLNFNLEDKVVVERTE